MRTTGSSDSQAWKQQIYDATARAVTSALPHGPVALRVRFGMAAGRNWATLWKPTIDALGPVLGMKDPRKPFHPNDDRIVDLELHQNIDTSLVHDVNVDVWWKVTAATERTSL